MHDLAFLPHLTGFAVQPLRIDAERVDLRATAIQRWAACPVCRRPSSRVHSRYERHVADLPWNRARVVLHVLARRFRCAFAECPSSGIPKWVNESRAPLGSGSTSRMKVSSTGSIPAAL